MLEAAYRDACDERVLTADAENLCLDALLRAGGLARSPGHTAVAGRVARRRSPRTGSCRGSGRSRTRRELGGPQSQWAYGIEPLLASMMASQRPRGAAGARAHGRGAPVAVREVEPARPPRGAQRVRAM